LARESRYMERTQAGAPAEAAEYSDLAEQVIAGVPGERQGEGGSLIGWTTARRNRTLLVAAVVVLVGWVLWRARGALFPYVFAMFLAYLMVPVVNWLDQMGMRRLRLKSRATRVGSILLVYLATVGLVALFFSMVVPVITQQWDSLWAAMPSLADRLQVLSVQALRWYRENVPVQLQAQIEANLRSTLDGVIAAAQAAVLRTFTMVTGTVSFVLGFVVIPFWLFYVLYDEGKLVESAHRMFPDRYWPDVRNLARIVDSTFSAYIRGQVLLSLAIGVMATIGLMLLHVQFPAVLGLVAALFEFLPFIGPILGAIPAVIVATIQQPILGLWTALLFEVIQQLEGSVLAPRISGGAVKLHPALIMVALVVGNELAGLWGMLVAVPLTAIVRDVFRYLYLRFQELPVPSDEALSQVRPPRR
jgi:predicted PurR-regulated permease PerM